jgi:hypothetical protein
MNVLVKMRIEEKRMVMAEKESETIYFAAGENTWDRV